MEGPHGVRGTGGGHVDGIGHELAGEGQHHLLGDLLTGFVLGLGRAGAEVGCDDHLLEAEQGRRGARLGGKYVDGSAADVARRDGVRESLLVEEPATGGVDYADSRLGLGKQLLADKAPGLRGARKVDGHEIRAGEHIFELGELGADLARPVRGHIRVVGDEPHTEGGRPLGHERADATEADDPERLAVQLDALPLGALPAPLYEGRGGPGGCCGPGRA